MGSSPSKRSYAAPNEIYDDPDPDLIDATSVRLGDVVPVGGRFTYTYDFGDDWRHDVLVEEELEVEPNVPLPRCIGGRRGCPPEDVGGVWGYTEFLEAWRDPNLPRHEEMRDWAGPYFDPEAFDPDEVTRYFRESTSRSQP
ncbi:MAG: plasmid pRiA4b ORF-3 family protein [Nocardioidaceae bacterium]